MDFILKLDNLIPNDFDALWDMLLTYPGDHYWEFIWYEDYNQMALWFDGRPVYIFKDNFIGE